MVDVPHIGDPCPGVPGPPATPPGPLLAPFALVAGSWELDYVLAGVPDPFWPDTEEETEEDEDGPCALAVSPAQIAVRRKKGLPVADCARPERPLLLQCAISVFQRASPLQKGAAGSLRRVSSEKPIGCDLCPARFSERGSLARHHRTHL